MKANPNAPPPPKALTKASLEAEALARDTLRKEFLIMQEAVKNTDILIPFVFYDGTSIPAGAVKVKKGDHIWLFLDRCRKVGAEMGVRGASGASKAKKDNRREWARVSVDDLMLVKGDIIVPHVSSPGVNWLSLSSNIHIALRVLLLHRQSSAQFFSSWRFAV
jgi:protein FAM50